MTKQQILNGYQQMRNEIAVQKDSYLIKIHTAIKRYFKDTSKEKRTFKNFIKQSSIDNLIFDSLEKTYSIVSRAIKELYGIEVGIMSQSDIEKLMYSKDGKNLYLRLKEHFEEACKRENPQEYLFNRYVLILDTETFCVSNGLIHGKIYKDAKFAEVTDGAECQDEPGSECEFWIAKGKMPIEELEELPPFHPDCDCEVIYYFK